MGSSYTPQQKYDVACSIYNEIINDLEFISNELKINPQVFIGDFDVILQYILLNEGLADGELEQIEVEFIAKITKCADLVMLVNLAMNSQLTWSSLQYINNSELKERIMNLIGTIVYNKSDDFISILSLYDAITNEVDILEKFVKKIFVIVATFANIDGTSEDSELESAKNDFFVLLYDRWNKRKNIIKNNVEKRNKFLANGKKIVADRKFINIINYSSNKLINMLNDRKKMKSCVVYIEGANGSGTGFIISKDGYAITCAHVVSDLSDLKVKIIDENDFCKIVLAKAVYFDEKYDLALIKIECDNLNYVELDLSDNISIGDEVGLFGYPLGRLLNNDIVNLNMSYIKGYVSSNQIEGGINRTLLDISAMPGYSGGPILSLNNGKVVGVLAGAIGSQENGDKYKITYMIPINYIKNLFETNNEE